MLSHYIIWNNKVLGFHKKMSWILFVGFVIKWENFESGFYAFWCAEMQAIFGYCVHTHNL